MGVIPLRKPLRKSNPKCHGGSSGKSRRGKDDSAGSLGIARVRPGRRPVHIERETSQSRLPESVHQADYRPVGGCLVRADHRGLFRQLGAHRGQTSAQLIPVDGILVPEQLPLFGQGEVQCGFGGLVSTFGPGQLDFNRRLINYGRGNGTKNAATIKPR